MALSRRSSWTLAICSLALVAGALGVSARSSSPDKSCEVLRQWARPWTDKSPTLAELTAFNGGRQRAIFSVLTPAARVSLWREHLGALAQRSEFSAAQRAAAAELRAVVVPEIYTRGSAAQEHARAAWKAREALFPDPAQRRAFLVLGAAPVVAPVVRQIDW